MALSTRLQKLLPALTPKQRIILILRAQAAGEEPDQELRRVADPMERREYDAYAALVTAANNELGMGLRALTVVAGNLADRADDIELLGRAAAFLAADQGLPPPKPPARGWRRKQVGVPVVTAHSMRGLHSTLALQAGTSSHVVAASLGHESITTTLQSYADPAAVGQAKQRAALTVLQGGI